MKYINKTVLFKINLFKCMYTKQSQSLRMQKKRPCYFSFVFRQKTLFPSYLVISQLRHQTLRTNQSQSQKNGYKHINRIYDRVYELDAKMSFAYIYLGTYKILIGLLGISHLLLFSLLHIKWIP